jgi:hypothetical protein
MTAADRLGISFLELKSEIAEGAIVAVSTGMGMRVSKEEMIAAAMRTLPQAVIEEALGGDAARVMPEAIRLVELRPGCRGIRKRCCNGWRAGIRPRSMTC